MRKIEGTGNVDHVAKVLEGENASRVYTTGMLWKRQLILEVKLLRRSIKSGKTSIAEARCKKCGKQGVGSTGEFAPRISNYITHIENKHEMTCVAQHFWKQDHSVKDFSIKGIVKLVNPPHTKKAKTNMLEDFEYYWQARLNTFKPFGLNDFKEYQEHRKRRGKDYLVKF